MRSRLRFTPPPARQKILVEIRSPALHMSAGRFRFFRLRKQHEVSIWHRYQYY
jgi:hypothetical protein